MPFILILAAVGVIIVFVICFLIVQWWIARQKPNVQLSDSARVRRTLENTAQTLGGSDFLRQYPPPDDSDRTTRDA